MSVKRNVTVPVGSSATRELSRSLPRETTRSRRRSSRTGAQPRCNRTHRHEPAQHVTTALVGADGLRDLSEHRLKDLAAPERSYQLRNSQYDSPMFRAPERPRVPLFSLFESTLCRRAFPRRHSSRFKLWSTRSSEAASCAARRFHRAQQIVPALFAVCDENAYDRLVMANRGEQPRGGHRYCGY
jgi:hypothetical protein